MLIDGSRGEDAALLGRRLASIAGAEVLELPFFDALAAAERGESPEASAGAAQGAAMDAGYGGTAVREPAPAAAAERRDSSSKPARVLQAALDGLRPSLRRAEADGYALATSAAARCVDRQLGQLLPGPSAGPNSSGRASAEAAAAAAAAAAPLVLNTTSDRGLASSSPEEFLEPGIGRGGCITCDAHHPSAMLQCHAACAGLVAT